MSDETPRCGGSGELHRCEQGGRELHSHCVDMPCPGCADCDPATLEEGDD